MHGVLVTVNLDAAQFEAARKALQEQVIPNVKKMPGIVRGFWTRGADGTQGVSLVVFDTKEHADSASQFVRSTPPPPGVTHVSIEVREVIADV
jgi:hypothetical protein